MRGAASAKANIRAADGAVKPSHAAAAPAQPAAKSDQETDLTTHRPWQHLAERHNLSKGFRGEPLSALDIDALEITQMREGAAK